MSASEPVDPAMELKQATGKQRRLIIIGGVIVLALAVVAVFLVQAYSSPRERRKKWQRLTQTAFSWYTQLAQCLGGRATPGNQPNEIYRRTLEAYEDDPTFIARAKECGQALEMVDRLTDFQKIKPGKPVLEELNPLITEAKDLNQKVTDLVAIAIDGPIHGEDPGPPLYDALWRVATGFERLHGVTGLPTPLAPPPTGLDTPGVAQPGSKPWLPPSPTALDIASLGDPGQLRAGPQPSQGGVLVVGFAGDATSGALIYPSGGVTADIADLRGAGALGPYLVDRDAAKLVQVDASYQAASGVQHRHFLGPSDSNHPVAAAGRRALAVARLKSSFLAVVSGPGGALALAQGGKEVALASNAELLAFDAGGPEAHHVTVVYRQPLATDAKKAQIEVRLSNDGGLTFGNPFSTAMDPPPMAEPSPACAAGDHIWFAFRETGYHSDNAGKTWKKFTVFQPKGGGMVSQLQCTADGGVLAMFRPRNISKRGLWVAGCQDAGCTMFSDPFAVTARRATAWSVALVGQSVLVAWSEARRARIRRMPDVHHPHDWEPSRALAEPADFPADGVLLGVSARPEPGAAVVGWLGAGHALHVVGTSDSGVTFGPP